MPNNMMINKNAASVKESTGEGWDGPIGKSDIEPIAPALNPAGKKIVRYAPRKNIDWIRLDQRASVVTIDHPDTMNLWNGFEVSTSPVLKINLDGSFETLNTLYVPDHRYDGNDRYSWIAIPVVGAVSINKEVH